MLYCRFWLNHFDSSKTSQYATICFYVASQVQKVCGEEVKNLRHLQQLVEVCTEEYVKLEFEDNRVAYIHRAAGHAAAPGAFQILSCMAFDDCTPTMQEQMLRRGVARPKVQNELCLLLQASWGVCHRRADYACTCHMRLLDCIATAGCIHGRETPIAVFGATKLGIG